MFIYEYTLRALDFVYFARKSLVGDITPTYIHSTALNAAVQTVLNMRKDEKYITTNEPKYDELFKNIPLYLTPARPISVNYTNQGITSNPEAYMFKVVAGEILKFQPIRVITPESLWKGFVISKDELRFLKLKIRLGRGRSPAEIAVQQLIETNAFSEGTVTASHVGDPLNFDIQRGFIINTLPYPLVEAPTISGKYITMKDKIIAIPKFLSSS